MDWHGRKVGGLDGDGWEEADFYHWMMDRFATGHVVVFLPDVRTPDEGPPIAWHDVMRPGYYGLVDASVATRVATLTVLTKQAHDAYAQLSQ